MRPVRNTPAGFPELRRQQVEQVLRLADAFEVRADCVEEQPQQREPLVEPGLLRPEDDGVAGFAGQDLFDLVVAAVLVEEVVIDGKSLAIFGSCRYWQMSFSSTAILFSS